MDHRVRFLPSEREERVPHGANLLEAAHQAGLPVASACGAERICGRCGLKIIEGSDTLAPETEREHLVKSRNRVEPGLRLACFIEVTGDLVVTARYW